jgi:hypothetical protein
MTLVDGIAGFEGAASAAEGFLLDKMQPRGLKPDSHLDDDGMAESRAPFKTNFLDFLAVCHLLYSEGSKVSRKM